MCVSGEGERTKTYPTMISAFNQFFFSTDTAPDTHCRQIISCYIKTGKGMYELFMDRRSLGAAICESEKIGTQVLKK